MTWDHLASMRWAPSCHLCSHRTLRAILCSQGIERSDPVHFQHHGLPLVPWRQLGRGPFPVSEESKEEGPSCLFKWDLVCIVWAAERRRREWVRVMSEWVSACVRACVSEWVSEWESEWVSDWVRERVREWESEWEWVRVSGSEWEWVRVSEGEWGWVSESEWEWVRVSESEWEWVS